MSLVNTAMNWEQLLSPARFGKALEPNLAMGDLRTEFQRDYDRLIFSSPFRRLQNKTQVFPLPGSVFVHNRLTHSLEVASVGRSLGNQVARELIKQNHKLELIHEAGTIVSVASLAHDLGNPPFGHSGENAISDFFMNGAGKVCKEHVSEAQWSDLIYFEGNANALRLLTHTFNGRRKGGYVLTYATLASLIKYPFSSQNRNQKNKYGFFDSEKEIFQHIAQTTGLLEDKNKPGVFARHPLVYLVEAADDISYLIMDMEDAHKLGFLSTEKTQTLLLDFFENNHGFLQKKDRVFQEVSDRNEQIAFLRASVINELIKQCATIFMVNQEAILAGNFSGSIIDRLQGTLQKAMDECRTVAVRDIYKHPSVVKIEITGYQVLTTLLEAYVPAMLYKKGNYSKKLLSLMPEQYQGNNGTDYEKIRSVLDFISGMTDLYALELYKLLKGIGI